MRYPAPLQQLIEVLRKLPGVGSKSAERFAFHLLQRPSHEMDEMAAAIRAAPQLLKKCVTCGCLRDQEGCLFCHPARDVCSLCVIASPRDAFSIEATHEFKGHYHVLDGLLSPLEGRGPDHVGIPKLLKRLSVSVEEVILALDASLEGDATALYLREILASHPLKVSRLAFGLPMGSSLEYVDGGTLARALTGRN